MAKTMVFIDSRVKDLDLLVSQFEAGAGYKVLDASYDGLFQMEESLARKYDYSFNTDHLARCCGCNNYWQYTPELEQPFAVSISA